MCCCTCSCAAPLAAQAANAVSLLLTAVANTAVNRRVTFGIRGRRHAARHQVRGLIAFAIGLALTSGALAALHASAPRAGRTAELTVLVAANLTATLVRFGLYRTWVFRHPRPGSPPGGRRPAPPAGTSGSGRPGGAGGSGSGPAITGRVKAHFTGKTVGGRTVYDLTTPGRGS